jgi:hypothetical protein
MRAYHLAGIAAAALLAGSALAQVDAPVRGPAKDGTPAWFLQGSFPDPGGRTNVEHGGKVTAFPRPPGGPTGPAAAGSGNYRLGCHRSPVCDNPHGLARQALQRVQYEQTMGYSFTYPVDLPPGFGGVPAVALDSKGNLWVYQRKPVGSPQLLKYDRNYKLILSVGDDVIGHAEKAHGMAVDAQDNVWILDTTLATAKKVSPDGKLLQTIGTSGHPGDWDEAKGQRLLWQPVMIAFGPTGDIFIAEGHANESPNDTESDDPTNNIGAARIIHLDKAGTFVNQWYGNANGRGKFEGAHGFAIDPTNGDVWIGDREQYRIVVYNAKGQFLKSIVSQNLVCAIQFDADGNPWMASGQDGQFLKMDRNGKVLGAIGNGMGIGPGQFIEASYWVFDKQNNLYAGDTSVGRVTVMVAPKK